MCYSEIMIKDNLLETETGCGRSRRVSPVVILCLWSCLKLALSDKVRGGSRAYRIFGRLLDDSNLCPATSFGGFWLLLNPLSLGIDCRV